MNQARRARLNLKIRVEICALTASPTASCKVDATGRTKRGDVNNDQELTARVHRLLARQGIIGEGDVARLHREVLPNNLTSREEAEVLVSLDRAVLRKCEMWNDAFVSLLVDFAVWASRPTGKIDREMATWLVTTLGARSGPTQNGINAAFEIVREAQQVDEALIAFVLDGARNNPVNSAGKRRGSLGLAA